MKATEVRDKIFKSTKILHEISSALSEEIEWDGIDSQYLNDKIIHVKNLSNHIKNQLYYIKKKSK